MGKIYQVLLWGYRGDKLTIDLCDTKEQMESMTVLQLKEKIAQRIPDFDDLPLYLLFADRVLDSDEKTLSHYGIQHLCLIHIMLKVHGWGSPGFLEETAQHDKNGKMGDKKDKNRSMEKLADF